MSARLIQLSLRARDERGLSDLLAADTAGEILSLERARERRQIVRLADQLRREGVKSLGAPAKGSPAGRSSGPAGVVFSAHSVSVHPPVLRASSMEEERKTCLAGKATETFAGKGRN